MADYLSRACRLQLTTAMENLIRTAVFEISQIFEDNLYDHQMELARKGEEIAYLKIKLQRAELRLKEVSVASGTDPSLNPSDESPRTSEEPAPQSSIAPVVDYEVPDDWCVPLDSENVKQENPCPSVRLKQFSITLSPIPLKHEAFSKLEESRLEESRLASRPKDAAQTGLQEEAKPKRKRGRPRKTVPPMNIKKEPIDIEVEPLTQGMERKAKEQKIRKCKNISMKTQASPSEKAYHCRFCAKVFNTAFGLSVHDRAHKKCRGCKQIFPFPSILMQHKMKCKFYKKLMKSSNASSTETVSKENSSTIEQKDKSLVQMKSSVRKIKMFTCKCCLKQFNSRSHLMAHPCFISCQTCHKRLSSPIALAVHTAKVHKSLMNLKERKRESWTKPLDELENSEEKCLSPCERAKQNIQRCPQGFKCLICKKIYSSKYTAVEHTFMHTGEKPFKCGLCSQTFSQRNNLSIHRRKYHGVVIRKVIKCACSKRFFIKSKYKEHKLICPKAGK